MFDRRTFLLASAASVAACSRETPSTEAAASPKSILAAGAELEVLAEGYGWSEGPTWDYDRGALYFTDVPGNTAYQWTRASGVEVFLQPSGTDSAEGFREPGANGLCYEGEGKLLVCNHGLRRVERLDIATGERTPLASSYNGEPFNSPNDICKAADGTIYFTDPPYGLQGQDDSPMKRQDSNGVYRLKTDGTVERLLSDMVRPNGIALSPDESTLYITQSDRVQPILRRATPTAAGLDDVRTLMDISPYMGEDTPGYADGMAIAASGEVLVAGPGGVLVISPEGELVERIMTDSAAANCCFGEDGTTLFITAHKRLLRVRTTLTGAKFA
ncbi:SMP-30/gluconolactonase/LRE family protein [Parvularcula sp. ZS-1/3]|uniref:SMP-30/gluconolactonase/LRE family protein n=1 Tax=Parvularcula mediterranea TaxID=2732508 RepID=A0A7Y3W581_9PROT|nr:SMP-30/gluconolactonase/LRE family protein [Parvularcula mediterranea]